MEMALERVGFGALFLAPNRRFILLVWLRTWCSSSDNIMGQVADIECLPAQKLKMEVSAKPRKSLGNCRDPVFRTEEAKNPCFPSRASFSLISTLFKPRCHCSCRIIYPTSLQGVSMTRIMWSHGSPHNK